MPSILFDSVAKTFKLHHGRALLAGHLRGLWKRRRASRQTLYALRDVSFRIGAGESVALIGSNGAGKSTALSLMAGLARPDAGAVRVEGRMATLLELGSGFHPDLTGEENVILNASLLGMSRRAAREALPLITAFAGLEEFIGEPLRTYSMGMVMRLAFATATHVEPDIVLIDEVLAVGDQDFQSKCAARLDHLRGEGRTLVCVSHDLSTVLRICTPGLCLAPGGLRMDGPVREVVAAYQATAAAAAPA